MNMTEGKLERWWSDLMLQARDKGIRITVDEIERIWRRTKENVRDTLKPSDPNFNSTIMLQVKKRVLQEDKSSKLIYI